MREQQVPGQPGMPQSMPMPPQGLPQGIPPQITPELFQAMAQQAQQAPPTPSANVIPMQGGVMGG